MYKKLASLNRILNIEKLLDRSRELVIFREYLLELKCKLSEMFPTYSIKADYNPLNLIKSEVGKHSYKKAITKRVSEFYNRVK